MLILSHRNLVGECLPQTLLMPIIEIFKGAAPYVICNVIVLISISLWGPLTTALPQLLGYSIF